MILHSSFYRIEIQYCTGQYKPTDFSLYLRPGFDLSPVLVGFEVSEMASKHMLLRFCPVSIIPPMLDAHLHQNSLLSEGRAGWSLGKRPNRPMSIWISGKAMVRNSQSGSSTLHFKPHTFRKLTPPPQYPQGVMLLVAEVLGMGTSRPKAKTWNPLAKHNPPLQLQDIRVTTQQCVPQPATTAISRSPTTATFGRVTVSATVVSVHYAVRIR